jgi:hypothetical protein
MRRLRGYRGEQGQLIDSAAFDLVPVSTESAGKENAANRSRSP